MDEHRVLNRRIGKDIATGDAVGIEVSHGLGCPGCNLQPDSLPTRGKGGVGNGKAKCLGNRLRRCGGAEKLTSSAGGSTRATTSFGSLFEGHNPVGKTCPYALNFSGVFTVLRR